MELFIEWKKRGILSVFELFQRCGGEVIKNAGKCPCRVSRVELESKEYP